MIKTNINKEFSQLLALQGIESELLDIADHFEDFTTSDIQGVIAVQVHKAYDLGKSVFNK